MRNQKSTIIVFVVLALGATVAMVSIYQSQPDVRREKGPISGRISPSADAGSVIREDSDDTTGTRVDPGMDGGAIAEQPLQEFSYSRMQMAMPVRITVWCESQDKAETACKLAFNRMTDLVKIFSDYDPDSEINWLVNNGFETSIELSPELSEVLSFSRKLNFDSHGAFDPTCGAAIAVWREARKTGVYPSSQTIEEARRHCGFENITVDPDLRRAMLHVPGMRLDFGGIAKGFIGDEVLRVLEDNGIDVGCFEAGGDIVLGQSPPGTDGWEIDVGSGVPLLLSSCGVSTSGDAQQFVVIDGKRYSHVIDPRTGIGVTTGRTAFVIAPCGMQSDALATTGTVLDDEDFQSVLGAFENVRGWSVVNEGESELNAE